MCRTCHKYTELHRTHNKYTELHTELVTNIQDYTELHRTRQKHTLQSITSLKLSCHLRELLKKRQWKEKLKDSGHLVFEILEAVIKKEEAV